MTVTEIVRDLLKYDMITLEAATVLLNTEFKATLFDKLEKNSTQIFQPYDRVRSGNTSNPYYVSTTINDPMINTTTTGLNATAIELLKTK